MKIRIEIDTDEPSPDIVKLVSGVVERALATHGNDNDDVRLDGSVDSNALADLVTGRAYLEESNVTRGIAKYATNDGQTYSATFTLETTP